MRHQFREIVQLRYPYHIQHQDEFESPVPRMSGTTHVKCGVRCGSTFAPVVGCFRDLDISVVEWDGRVGESGTRHAVGVMLGRSLRCNSAGGRRWRGVLGRGWRVWSRGRGWLGPCRSSIDSSGFSWMKRCMKNLDVCKPNNFGSNGQIWVFSTFVIVRKTFSSDELSP